MPVAPDLVQTLADFTDATLMLPKLQGRTMPEVMCELSQALHQQDASVPDILYPSLKALTRELLTSRALDAGSAFPEVRLAEVIHPRFALGRADVPLAWRAVIFPPLEFVFLILQPARPNATCKKLVTGLKRVGTNAQSLARLREARDAHEMLAVLRAEPLPTA